jgi:hypothetical protein
MIVGRKGILGVVLDLGAPDDCLRIKRVAP